jgi:thioredoxin-dependent peroxiredoxin
MAAPSPGDIAPPFTLARDGGGPVSLADFAGRKVVIFVYPEANSPSCTKEAEGFSALAADFAAAGTVVLGLSPDPVAKQDKFRDKRGLTVPLLSDPDRQFIEAYGLWIEKSMYGKTYMGVERATFLIGPDGRVAEVWHNVRVKDHADTVLAAARAL